MGREPQRRAATRILAKIPGKIEPLEGIQPVLCSIGLRTSATQARERSMGMYPE